MADRGDWVTAFSPKITVVTPDRCHSTGVRDARMSVMGLDLDEINEAFVAQVVPRVRELARTRKTRKR